MSRTALTILSHQGRCDRVADTASQEVPFVFTWVLFSQGSFISRTVATKQLHQVYKRGYLSGLLFHSKPGSHCKLHYPYTQDKLFL